MDKKVFLSGKITEDANYKDKFSRVETFFKNKGYIVLNPACLPEGLSTADYMRICFAMIDTSDAVVFIDDYDSNSGSSIEHDYCDYTKKEMLYIKALKFNDEEHTK